MFLLSLTKCHGVPCSLPSRITTKVLKKLLDFFFKTETKTKTFIFVLEAPRDQDRGLEDYITGMLARLSRHGSRARVKCELRKCEMGRAYFASWNVSETCEYLGKVPDGRICESWYRRHPSHLLKDWRVQLESIISRPIALCPPSISANWTRGDAILFAVCRTGLKGLRGQLGWEPAQATTGATAAAEVTGAGATSSRRPRDGADVGAAANIVVGASGGSMIFERGQVPKERGSRRCRRRWGIGNESPSPEIKFKLLVLTWSMLTSCS